MCRKHSDKTCWFKASIRVCWWRKLPSYAGHTTARNDTPNHCPQLSVAPIDELPVAAVSQAFVCRVHPVDPQICTDALADLNHHGIQAQCLHFLKQQEKVHFNIWNHWTFAICGGWYHFHHNYVESRKNFRNFKVPPFKIENMTPVWKYILIILSSLNNCIMDSDLVDTNMSAQCIFKLLHVSLKSQKDTTNT